MEVKAGGKSSGGFVNFRSRDSAPATVPAHLRANAPDPLQSYYNKPKASKKNEGSAATKSRIEQLKAALAAEDAELEERRAKLPGNKKKLSRSSK